MPSCLLLAVLALLVAVGHTSRAGPAAELGSASQKPGGRHRGRTSRALRAGEGEVAGSKYPKPIGSQHVRSSASSGSSRGVSGGSTLSSVYKPKTAEPDLPIKYFHVPNTDETFITTLVHYANPDLPDAAAWPTNPDYCWDNIKKSEDPHDGSRGAFRPCGGKNPHPPYQQWDAMWDRDKWLTGRVYADEGGRFEGDDLVSDGVYDNFKGRIFGMFTHHERRMRRSHYWYCGGGQRGQGKRNAGVCSGGIGGFARKSQGTVVRMLSGQADGAECNHHASPCRDLEALTPDVKTAAARLDGFAFIGITEHWELSVCLFHDKFGGRCLESETQRADGSEAGWSGDTRKLDDPYDGALYADAVSRFFKEIDDRELTPDKCAEICPHVDRDLFSMQAKHARS